MTCIFNALLTTNIFPSTGYSTLNIISILQGWYLLLFILPISLCLIIDFHNHDSFFFGHYGVTWPKSTQQKHLMSQLQKVGVSLLHLLMAEMYFFSLGYSALPSSFGCDWPTLMLAFQLGFQGVEELNGGLFWTIPFCLTCLSTFMTIYTISFNPT
jgi:hypothetical protein